MADPLIPVAPLRLRHAHGEALRADDFARQAAQDDQLRWWHNRAVHDPFGVVQGLSVVKTNGVATVSPGLAYDRNGRELILRAESRIALPAEPEKFRLVIGYRAVGGAAGPVRLAWSPLTRPLGADGVPLATGGDQPFTAPRARLIAAPRVGHGVTQPGMIGWELWFEELSDGLQAVGLQLRVDTSASGFTAVPCYFVQFTGELWSSAVPDFLNLPLHHLADPERDSFTYRVLVPQIIAANRLAGDIRRGIVGAFFPVIESTLFWTGIQQHADDISTSTTRTGDR